ncbi:MAG TPA: hypothetical protein VKA70_08775 [Blastocatellia bacterium]|nr:hypothetical protein [Blastocatellia bacterium]
MSLLVVLSVPSGNSGTSGSLPTAQTPGPAPDFSGLAWVEGDTFLALHDAKYPDEKDRVRVSLLSLPRSLDGITLKPLAIDWPSPQGPSSDLESVARIPGTNSFLLTESGEQRDDNQRFRRIFLTELRDGRLVLLSFAELPATVNNIEGSAVWKTGSRLTYIFAERGDGLSRTEFYWASLETNPLRVGPFQKTYFSPVGFTGANRRPVSAVEVDSKGRIYISSAYDTEDDNGPFTSVIWRAGRFQTDRKGGAMPVFLSRPQKLATLDGLKVESLAVREMKEGLVELFAGTDDENYGGAVRPIPIRR